MAKYVRKLHLTNVRQFKEETFEFLPGFNLLVGENGMGKTTLLRSILAVLVKANQELLRNSLSDQDIRLRSSELFVKAEIATLDGEPVGSPVYKHKLGEPAKPLKENSSPMVLWYGSNEATCSSFVSRKMRRVETDLQIKMMEEERWLHRMHTRHYRDRRSKSNFGRSEDIEMFVGRVLSNFSGRFREFGWIFEPYDCSILQPKEADSNKKLSPRTKRAYENAVLRHLRETERNRKRPWPDKESITIDSRGTILGSEKKEDELEHVGYNFREMLRNLDVDSNNFSYLEQCTIKVRLTPRIRIFEGSMDGFLLSQLSDGEQRLFSLFVDIARQLSLQQDGRVYFENSSAIILIDEIDVHLHPKWQRMIVPALEELFPSCQFIATTHSPFVVQSVQENNVQHLNRNISGQQFTDRGIEEIAVKVMDVDPLVSPRYLKMLDTARDYFRLLEKARGMKGNSDATSGELKELKLKLDGLSHKYAQNPAFQAYLELHGLLTLGPDDLR
jgi:energy-coupling factor transporter ATP-binding protein EcfA2